MRIFKDLKLVEQLGSGIPRILKHYDKKSFYISDNFIRLTFNYEMSEKMSEKILTQIELNNFVTIKQLSELLSVAKRTIERSLKSLQDKGLVKRVGPAKGGYWEIIKK
jgi:ATP-dependent DNA helicase RecG